MKAVEAVKEKFYCFLGIVHPTYYQSRGWGPWLQIYQHFDGNIMNINLLTSCQELVRVPNLYFRSRLGVQYPKNSKIFLWLLPQPSFGDALV